MFKIKISTDVLQKAYFDGRNDERKRWARSLRKWLKIGEDDHTLQPCVWVDAILEKVSMLAKKPK